MSLARNTLVQSTLTLGSRILGFVRDMALAALPWVPEADRARFGQRLNAPDQLLAMIAADLAQALRAAAFKRKRSFSR